MEVKLKLSNDEHKDLVAYCNLNDLLISSVVKDSFTTGFAIERYGLLNSGIQQEKIVEKEIIVEKKVEVPVEVIKEVVKVEYVEIEKPIEKVVERIVEKPIEIIKEIPVDKVIVKEIIKEVPVEKIVYVTDHQELNEKIKEFSNKTEELENNFQKEKKELLLQIQNLENREPEVREVVKEVEVIREIVVEGDSKNKMDALQSTIFKLKQDNIDKDKKIQDLEKKVESLIQSDLQRGAIYLQGSNLDNKLYK